MSRGYGLRPVSEYILAAAHPRWSLPTSWLFLLTSLWLAAPLVAGECEKDSLCPTFNFRSRPDIHAPVMDMELLRPELTTPGYIFIAPYHNKDPGPYIYDNYGNLVWSASGQSGPKVAHDPHVCTYKGQDHICFFQGQQYQGFARGHGTIMDKHYRVVAHVESAGALTCSDMHEFRLTPYSNSATALLSIYHTRAFDLTANPHFLIKNGMGWIVDSVFQEVDIETGSLVFEWRSLDHVDPSLSFTYPGTTDTSGSGLQERSPWDYFHLNSVDKNKDGDYLISARHMWAIYKVSGLDGSIIWQLGGKQSSFKMMDFAFGYQHHARWITENATHTVLSFFDNSYNGFTHVSDASAGLVIVIDHIMEQAFSINTWTCPGIERMSVGSQGSLQLLESGNVHVGWGEWPWFSEHTADGSAVQLGKMRTGRIRDYMHYRSGKFNWTGMPIVNPSLWTYALTNDSANGMVFYSSWNGATEVAAWNYYLADDANGPYELVANAPRHGFETMYQHKAFGSWAYAEALDSDEKPLGRSEIAKTFVPSQNLRQYCNVLFCASAERERDSAKEQEMARLPDPDPMTFTPRRGFNTSSYYALGAAYVAAALRDSSSSGGGDVDMSSLMLGVVLTIMTATLLLAVYLLALRLWSSTIPTRVHNAWEQSRLRNGQISYTPIRGWDVHKVGTRKASG